MNTDLQDLGQIEISDCAKSFPVVHKDSYVLLYRYCPTDMSFFFKLNIFSVGGKATKNLSCGDHFIIKGCSMVTF